jgi:hypothetical protein
MTAEPKAPGRRVAWLLSPLRGLRDAWLVFGIALALFLALEFGYRLQVTVKQAITGKAPAVWDSPDHPYHGQAWYPEFAVTLARRTYDLDPYRGFWARPLATRYVNIDSAGRRVTPQPPVSPGARRILMFGGSAMWGNTTRDSFTIAAQLASALARRGVSNIEVVSDAQPGFNTTQELATLEIEVARGFMPAVAVFMNGYNDAAGGVLARQVGHTFTQKEAQTLLDLGRRGFWSQLFGLGRFSQLVQRFTPGEARPPRIPADSICPRVAAYYANMERTVLAIAHDRGFPALIFLQPHNAFSHKRITRWESTLPRDLRLAACADSIASAMAPHAGTAFFDLRSLFDQDTGTVFVDYHAHVTEAANARIAEAMADRLVPLLTPERRR